MHRNGCSRSRSRKPQERQERGDAACSMMTSAAAGCGLIRSAGCAGCAVWAIGAAGPEYATTHQSRWRVAAVKGGLEASGRLLLPSESSTLPSDRTFKIVRLLPPPLCDEFASQGDCGAAQCQPLQDGADTDQVRGRAPGPQPRGGGAAFAGCLASVGRWQCWLQAPPHLRPLCSLRPQLRWARTHPAAAGAQRRVCRNQRRGERLGRASGGAHQTAAVWQLQGGVLCWRRGGAKALCSG